MIANHKYFAARQKVKNPSVVVRRVNGAGTPRFEHDTMMGTFYRVSASNPKEVFFLQSLEHRRDKFAPALNDGVIVTEAALALLDA